MGRDGKGNGRLSLVLEPFLDLEELWRIRSVVWREARPVSLRLDFAAVRSLAADALLLLHDELASLERRGARVRVVRVSARLRRQLRHHPIRRFLRDEEELFTDPDLDGVGFRPSRH